MSWIKTGLCWTGLCLGLFFLIDHIDPLRYFSADDSKSLYDRQLSLEILKQKKWQSIEWQPSLAAAREQSSQQDRPLLLVLAFDDYFENSVPPDPAGRRDLMMAWIFSDQSIITELNRSYVAVALSLQSPELQSVPPAALKLDYWLDRPRRFNDTLITMILDPSGHYRLHGPGAFLFDPKEEHPQNLKAFQQFFHEGLRQHDRFTAIAAEQTVNSEEKQRRLATAFPHLNDQSARLRRDMIMSKLKAFAIFLLIFLSLERLFPYDRQQKVKRRLWSADILHYFMNSIVFRYGVNVILVAVAVAIHHWVDPGFRDLVASQPLAWQVAEAIFLSGFCNYFNHRLMHTVPFLWKIHSVHHSVKEMDWLATFRLHPLNMMMNKLVPVIFLSIFGFSNETLGFYVVLVTLQEMFVHSNILFIFPRLSYLITTPDLHHWHHSQDPKAYNKNFAGELPLFDLMFGTFYLPKKTRPKNYGIQEDVGHSYWQQLLYPFKKENSR